MPTKPFKWKGPEWQLRKRDLRDDVFFARLTQGRKEPQSLDSGEGKESADAWGCPEVAEKKIKSRFKGDPCSFTQCSNSCALGFSPLNMSQPGLPGKTIAHVYVFMNLWKPLKQEISFFPSGIDNFTFFVAKVNVDGVFISCQTFL